MRLLAVLSVALVLSGCATTISAVKSRPVAAHDVDKTRLWTATGERRFVTWYVVDRNKYLLCPEPVPFTGQAITSASKPNLKPSEVVSLGTEEAYATTLTSIGTLTENLAALDRNFANSCNLYIAGVMHPDRLRASVEADNAVRRAYVLAAATSKTDDKALKAAVDAAVKAAVEKVKKELAAKVGVTIAPTSAAQ